MAEDCALVGQVSLYSFVWERLIVSVAGATVVVILRILMQTSGGAYCTTCMQTDCSVSTCSRRPCTRLVSFCFVLFFVVRSPVPTRLKPSNGRDEVVCDQTRQFRDPIGQQVRNYRRSPYRVAGLTIPTIPHNRSSDAKTGQYPLANPNPPSVPIHPHRHFPRQIGNSGRQPPSRTQPFAQP